ncbi:hypothetical protein L202_03414 [Cryptococcus amylolentus CBS 6039]|uniref:Auxin efflux carrier n=1 Tax=Cryptococcus amylolentus CBS 6039 TaxID=1295533 RepID=A0A1E3HSV2_9TREE|nr:hypothetical protein L202_03414 [Cryptococcus amylolentus CBS 6039]ODN79430.1 hypothetical protein L202_03414 [Cryptococcus amylolentus CBS 6039]
MAFSAAGVMIYKAFAPTLKMIICIAVGYMITKQGIFAPANAKGVSILSLNVALPALIFGSMVSALSVENAPAMGPLVLVAVIYQILGFMFAWLIKELFYVPVDFRYGILVMGTVSNWGNLPTAIVQTMAKSAPFDPDTDTELGVAYIAVFVFIMNLTLFPLGLHKLCAWDFREENLTAGPPLPRRECWRQRLQFIRGVFKKDRPTDSDAGSNKGKVKLSNQSVEHLHNQERGSRESGVSSADDEERGEKLGEMVNRARFAGGAEFARKKSRASSFHSMMESTRSIPATAPLDASGIAQPCFSPSGENANQLLPVCSTHAETYRYHQPVTPAASTRSPTWSQRIKSLAIAIFTPLTLSIILGIICSVITPVKALFVDVDNWSGNGIPYAPDGNPPLSFITDTATFLGGMSIPAGLVLLGASFARLKMPKKWSDLPIAAIVAMTVFKMILLPIFGVFVVQAMRDNTTMYPAKDKMRTFVSILVASTPSSVNQLVITQLYNPLGSADTLSCFLALQYALMPVLSTGLAAIALYITEQQ